MKIAVTQRYSLDKYKDGEWLLSNCNKKMFEDNGIFLIQVSNTLNIDEVVEMCDGLFIPGGADINPTLYGEEVNGTKDFYDFVDALDFAYISAFYKANKPILGICRGQQVINVYFGGSLYQDITNHNGTTHFVNVEKDSFVYDLYKTEKLEVNSWHHQVVKEVAPGFKVVARSEDGYVEALQKDKVYTVQWHPEMYDAKRFMDYIETHLFK